MSIKSSLKKIYTKLSGKNTDKTSISGILDDISTVAGSGGSGGGGLCINASPNEDFTKYTMDKTYNEISSAISNGVYPWVSIDASPDAGNGAFMLVNVIDVRKFNNYYMVDCMLPANSGSFDIMSFEASTTNDYPVYIEPDSVSSI